MRDVDFFKAISVEEDDDPIAAESLAFIRIAGERNNGRFVREDDGVGPFV